MEFSFILGEHALRNPVGGPTVLAAQLQHLLKLTGLPNVEIQVIPAGYGVHTGLNGSLILLETPDHKQAGYIESQGVSVVVTEPSTVSTFGLRYGKLRSQALHVEESARLIERVAGEL